jgi:beta-1,4-mannosyl-glycoprotein beta-1,4-N-acetylglucosaminyltransferase
MKFIDTFIFYNEIDLLLYRLSILDEYIDYFILVESTHTFTGHIKELYYEINKEKFIKFNHKIIHIIVDDFPYKYPNIHYRGHLQWHNEYHQRNCIKKGLDKIKDKLNDDDIILMSDLDEIPNPLIFKDIITKNIIISDNQLYLLELDFYYYNLNYKYQDTWAGTKLLTYKTYILCNLTFQQLRTWEWKNPVNRIKEPRGWHLSYFGDINFIKNKIANFSHCEYNNDKYVNDELENKIKKGIKYIDDTQLIFIPIHKNDNLPPKYDEFLKDYYIID